MRKLTKLLFSLLLVITLIVGFNYAHAYMTEITPIYETATEEDSTIEDGTIIIGITKFEPDEVLTAGKASKASYNDTMFHVNGFMNPNYLGASIYYLLLGDWYEIDDNNEIELITDEVLIEQLNGQKIYYVNNEEKMIEIDYDKQAPEGFLLKFEIPENMSKNNQIEVQSTKIIVPATARYIEVWSVEEETEMEDIFDTISIYGKIERDENRVGGNNVMCPLVLNSSQLNIFGGEIEWSYANPTLGTPAGNIVGVRICAPYICTQEALENAKVDLGSEIVSWSSLAGEHAEYIELYVDVREQSMHSWIVDWGNDEDLQEFYLVISMMGNVTLEDPVTVTFDVGEGVTEIPAITLKEGDAVEEPTTPSKTDHTFIGWYLGENEYDFESAVVENITLTAVFEPTWFYNAYRAETPVFTINSADRMTYLESRIADVNTLGASKPVKIEVVDGSPVISTDMVIGTGVTLTVDAPLTLSSVLTMDGTLENNSTIAGTGRIDINGIVKHAGVFDIVVKLTSDAGVIQTPWDTDWINFAGGADVNGKTFELALNSQMKVNEVPLAEANRGAIDIEFTSGTVILMSSHIITPNAKIVIGAGTTLIINEGITLYNYGELDIQGTLNNNGTIDDYNDITQGALQTIWASTNFTNADVRANRGLRSTSETAGNIVNNGTIKVGMTAEGAIDISGVEISMSNTGKFYIKTVGEGVEYIGSMGLIQISADSTMTFKTSETNGFDATITTGTVTIANANGMNPAFATSFFIGANDKITILDGATLVIDEYTVLNGYIVGDGTLTINDACEQDDLYILNDYVEQQKLGSELTIDGEGTYSRRNP